MKNNSLTLAYMIVNKVFQNEVDLAGEPYVNHVVRVSDRMQKNGWSISYRITALLHDIIENCIKQGWDEARIRESFSEKVADAVVAITRKEGQSYREYLIQVAENKIACAVKLYDLYDNMDLTRFTRNIGVADLKRIEKYHKAFLFLSKALKEKHNITIKNRMNRWED